MLRRTSRTSRGERSANTGHARADSSTASSRVAEPIVRPRRLHANDSFLSDRRNVAAAESYLRRAREALIDLGRHVRARPAFMNVLLAITPLAAEAGVTSCEIVPTMRRDHRVAGIPMRRIRS